VSLRIIVPHRGLAAAKTRLAGVLEPAEREQLARRLLDHVLRVVAEAAPGRGEVISPDAELRPLVEEAGLRLVVQRGMGLNTGLEQARAPARAAGAPPRAGGPRAPPPPRGGRRAPPGAPSAASTPTCRTSAS
jgi:hypothetical protein